jgi:hypothetical protein
VSFFSKLSSFFGGGGERPTSNAKPNGGDGVQAFGGFLVSNERSPELIGARKWITYSNATNTAIVATGLRYALGLLRGTTWHAEPNDRGGADADRGVEIVTQGLINARMPKPWASVVGKTALYKYFGFSLHEWMTARRSDGMVVFSEIAHRPQYTIDCWNKPSEKESWDAVSQLSQNGNRYTIPRGRLLYAVDDTLTDSPDGVGLFRHIVELVRRLGVLEGLEGLAYETDIRGMPIGRAPIAKMLVEAESKVGADKAKINAYVSDRTANMRNALVSLAKSPEKLQHLLLDSGTYRGATPDTITSIQEWGLELLRGDGNGVDAVASAIGRLQVEIARAFGIEFAMMGSGDGSLAMHGDKTGMLGVTLQTQLTEIADFTTNDLARPLIALNGLDPETCTPRLVAEPISTDAIETVCRALQSLASAGLAPNDPARVVIRQRMRLPPEPEPTPEMLGALGGGPPDPMAGEEDVPIDDLGAADQPVDPAQQEAA